MGEEGCIEDEKFFNLETSNFLIKKGNKDILSEICPCYYPDEFYESYRDSLNQEIGTCTNSDDGTVLSHRDQASCEADTDNNGTWEADSGRTHVCTGAR